MWDYACGRQSNKSGYKLKGDIKYDEVAAKCSFITLVPGSWSDDNYRLLQNTPPATKMPSIINLF